MSEIPFSVRGKRSGASSLDGLQDVSITSASNGQILRHDGTNFVNVTPTYLDSTGIADHSLIKVVSGQTQETGFFATSIDDTSSTLQTIIPTAGLLGITAGKIVSEVFDLTKTRVNITTGISTTGLTVTSDGNVGIGVTDPEEALDIEGNIELRAGGAGKILFKHPSGTQKVEVDGDVDGTNGGKFVVKTKQDGVNGNPTERLVVDNVGDTTISTGSLTVATQLTLGNVGTNQSVINFEDFTNIGTTTVATTSAVTEGSNGGKFVVQTKHDGATLVDRLTVNNNGAFGLGAVPTYGTTGQVLTSNGSASAVSWSDNSVATLTGMNLSTLVDGELLRRTDANNVGGSDLLTSSASVGGVSTQAMQTRVGSTVLSNITSTRDSTGVHSLTIEPSAGSSSVASFYNRFGGIQLEMNPSADIFGLNGVGLFGRNGGMNFFSHYNSSVTNAIFFDHTLSTFSPTSVRDGVYNLGSSGRRWATVYATNGTINTSDDRLKINETPITGALGLINGLTYYEYDKVGTLDGTDITHRERGVIAQELVNTELSFILSGGNTETITDPITDPPLTETKYVPYGIRYNDLFITLCSAVKELSAEVSALRQRVRALELG